ncbi:hypothetical protein A8709_13195 [Paenibacillus pectinilyticus]|uniref:Haloacid dehalogenase n=1 Tax=Paenibacillus pectinilyticus TaxID=512399 RepID=A0A1C1A3E2_9BACL|nr:HAD family hydrolase [Paenibacillus pectinilyticus]OCT15066.1 hypothetical protein A8709_13195 [Paenibacillus pectinilyticus]
MIRIKAVVFDFDGTISTLRAGWEDIMIPLMKDSITGGVQLSKEQEAQLHQQILTYIDQSTGIQTIYQMRWLAETVQNAGWNQEILDEWEYKAEYNRRLLERVKERVDRLEIGDLRAENFLIQGAAEFVKTLHEIGFELYMASGTDHPDVVREAEVLGVKQYFKEIVGAPVGKAECSKEKVLRDLMEEKGLAGNEVAVIGDGKVEILLGKEVGGLALGLASDEEKRTGINPVKERRLQAAGADWISGDFLNLNEWLEKLGV